LNLRCYCLLFGWMPPKFQVLRGPVTRVVILGSGGTFKRRSLVESLHSLGAGPWTGLWDSLLLLFLLFLWLCFLVHEVSALPHAPALTSCLTRGPKQWGL
jgi:hypothetical protein